MISIIYYFSLQLHQINSKITSNSFRKLVNTQLWKEYQTWYNTRFISYIQMFCFYFSAYWFPNFNRTIKTIRIYLQNHPETKYLQDVCLIFAKIPSDLRETPPFRDAMKNILVSYKQSINFFKKWLHAYYPMYCPVLFFLSRSDSHMNSS